MEPPKTPPTSQESPAINAMEPRKRRPDGRMPLPNSRPKTSITKANPHAKASHRHHKYWSKEDDDKLREHLSGEMTPRAIAALLNRSYYSVIGRMRRLEEARAQKEAKFHNEAADGKGGSESTQGTSSSSKVTTFSSRLEQS
ncbi:hypothetical protein VMCG_03840 [Cytospora schulzeri]|uniref:Myb-like domain-containing protein n=1 Tax=Cytospora schulzeri TaxID=448051 RepID=A0A423WUM9_9PEZI|nr:hypothetical protein VMCG_03840 [Valsa malicola]